MGIQVATRVATRLTLIGLKQNGNNIAQFNLCFEPILAFGIASIRYPSMTNDYSLVSGIVSSISDLKTK